MAVVTCLIAVFCLVQSSLAEEMHFEFPPEKMDMVSKGDEDAERTISASGNANKYLDSVLNSTKPMLVDKLEPLKLPDYESSFKKKFQIVTFTGGFQANNGILRGLSSLHRAGDATLSTTKDLQLKVRATLGLNDLFVGCNSKVWLGKLRIPFDMSASIKYVKASIEMQIADLADQTGKPEVTDFVIHEIGKINVDIKRLGPLNFVLKALGFVILNMLKSVLKTKLGPPILKLLNKSVQNIDVNNLLG